MSFLSKLRAQTQLALMGKGSSPEVVIVPEIPKNWDFFLGTKDRWVEVKFPVEENSTNALYLGQKGSVFRPHIHKFSDELMTVMNPTGRIKIITSEEVVYLTYGQSYVLPMGVAHAVIFEEETKVFIHWHPHFQKGWDAEFTEEEGPQKSYKDVFVDSQSFSNNS